MNRVFLLMVPAYASCGDQAICYAEIEYLKQKHPDSELITLYENSCMYELNNKYRISNSDTFYFQGGGNFGTLYPETETLRQKLISYLGNNKIIIFPQTVFFEDTDFGRSLFLQSEKIYSKKNITIAARDCYSYRFFREHYPSANSVLSSDMVVMMQGCFDVRKSEREGVVVSLRKDKEKKASIDSDSLLRSLGEHEKVSLCDMFFRDMTIDDANRRSFVHRTLQLFSSSKAVITDRLHGMLFCMVTHTPCVFFDNIYGKNKHVYEHLKPKSFIVFLERYDTESITEALHQAVSFSDNCKS